MNNRAKADLQLEIRPMHRSLVKLLPNMYTRNRSSYRLVDSCGVDSLNGCLNACRPVVEVNF
jgi:hypothetical protein